ncbi:MAG: DUF4118 domain-containing protein [Bacteroidota bacterium]|nr:DUF4118 domain-containing protein [Bacteroidota bacterium]
MTILTVISISGVCFASSHFLGYRVVALILLVTVSVLASIFDIVPVLLASSLSALIWNFFFIPPILTFHINSAEDNLMFLMYFLIALLNSTLTFKIREAESKARDKEEKDKTIRLYDTLLNSLSHELRTPIATILAAVDTIKENQRRLSTTSQEELLYEIEIASVRLNRQVNNLLNMSRLETGMLKPELNWCDVNELVYEALHKLQESPVRQKIHFVPDETLPLFKMDTGLIGEVIFNILQNAVQYTPEETTISIRVLLEGEYCVFEFLDNGVGLPENEIKFVFEKFYRVSHSKTGGTGLGLSIAKGFVEAHNGRIEASNNVHGGATFTLRIPGEKSYVNNLKNE